MQDCLSSFPSSNLPPHTRHHFRFHRQNWLAKTMGRSLSGVECSLPFVFLVIACLSAIRANSQTLPPARPDGFVYSTNQVNSDTIIIEAFLDPVCPDSRDAWWPLKKALEHYGSRLWLVVHLLPLPCVFTPHSIQISRLSFA